MKEIDILLIEDNPGDALLVRETLKMVPGTGMQPDEGYRLEVAETLEAGTNKLSKKDFDLVLLDLGLPDSQGLETLSSILSMHRDVAVIVMTIQSNEDLGMEAVKMGAQDYLFKGEVEPSQIVRSIRYSIERKRAELALRIANKKLNLLSNITRHDILNQITGLLTYEDLLEEVVTTEKGRRFLDIIKDATHTIEMEISFTRDYQDLGINNPTWQQISMVAGSVIGFSHPEPLDIRIETGDIEVLAEPMFDKVFLNLFENSVRHGGHVSEIHVSFQEDSDKRGIIIVEDNGVGVLPENKDKIFDRGFGSHTGYGMFLAKEILDITGITIRETGEYGKGARFEMIVPEGKWRNGEPKGNSLL